MAKGYQKHKQASLIPQFNSVKNENLNYLNTKIALKTHEANGNEATVLISFRLLQNGYQCFSDWSKSEMNSFWDFNKRVHDFTWQKILEQGSKKAKDKVGFAYTKINRSKYPNDAFMKSLDTQQDLYELRITGKSRVHGFRDGSIFYICYLDKNHDICG